MQVLFDLRPRHLVQSQDQNVDLIRLLSVLFFFVFVVTSMLNIGYTVMKLRDVKRDLTAAKGDKMVAFDKAEQLSVEIANMRVMKNRIKSYVEFTSQELPTVEFMALLEGATPTRLKITHLSIAPGNVLMRGAGIEDQDIVEFGARLDSRRNIVTRVDAPVTTKGPLGNRTISFYTMTCNIRSLPEIAEAAAASEVLEESPEPTPLEAAPAEGTGE